MHTINVLKEAIKFIDHRLDFLSKNGSLEEVECFKIMRLFIQSQINQELNDREALKQSWSKDDGLRIHVICEDENIKAAYLAEKYSATPFTVIEEMAKKEYEMVCKLYPTKFENYEHYRHVCFWHIHTIRLLNPNNLERMIS